MFAQKYSLGATHNWGGSVLGYSKRDKRNGCSRIYNQFGVQWDGIVVPCCVDVEGAYILGNAHENTFEEIFEGDAYNKLVALECRGKIADNALCKRCNI